MMVPRSADARFACAVLCRKTLSISSRWRRLEACSPTVCPDTWLHTAAEISWNESWERGWSVVLCDIADLSWKFGIRSSKFWRNAVSVHFLLSFFIFLWKLRFVLSISYQYSPLVSFNLMKFANWGHCKHNNRTNSGQRPSKREKKFTQQFPESMYIEDLAVIYTIFPKYLFWINIRMALIQ